MPQADDCSARMIQHAAKRPPPGGDTHTVNSMVTDWVWYRWGGAGIATAITAVMAVVITGGHTSLVLFLVSVLITGGLYAGLGFTALGNSGLTGLWRQQMTWDVYRDREWEPHEAELAAEAEQMSRVEARVTPFAAAHGLERITLAVTGARLGWADAAHSARSSKTRCVQAPGRLPCGSTKARSTGADRAMRS
jgi:hypothetical protein